MPNFRRKETIAIVITFGGILSFLTVFNALRNPGSEGVLSRDPLQNGQNPVGEVLLPGHKHQQPPSWYGPDITEEGIDSWQTRPGHAYYRDPSKGRWVPSPSRGDEAADWDATVTCTAYTPLENVSTEDALEMSKQRNTQVAAWEWVLEDGAPLAEWNVTAWFERALESRVGWVIVGDSLAVQTVTALEKLIRPPVGSTGPPLLIPSVVMTPEPHSYLNATTHVLCHDHPLYQHLLDSLPHVPRERFDSPVIWSYRSDNLITDVELEAVVHSDEVGLEGPLGPERRSISDWLGALTDMAQLPTWEGEKEGIIVVNSGPHWSPMHMQPASDDQLLAAYRKMLQIVYEKLLRLPTHLVFT